MDIYSFGMSIWAYLFYYVIASKIYGDITIEKPSPIFSHITAGIDNQNKVIQSINLPYLASACNNHLLPTSVYIWGVQNLYKILVGYLWM